MRRAALIAALTLLVLAPGAGASGLPLGHPGLPETRTAQTLAPGVTLTHVVRGYASPTDAFVVDVAFVTTQAQARATADAVRASGHDARIQRVSNGILVRSGTFADQASADALRAALISAGFVKARTVYTGEDGGKTRGPWVLDILRVEPKAFDGRVVPALATDVVPGREPVSALSGRLGALAAINGGYFVIGAENGTDGDLAGISVVGGQLVSEAVQGRTSLVLPNADGTGARIEQLRTDDSVRSSDGARRELDGLDRIPGLIRGCGGTGGDQPTQAPLHDVTCTDDSELIRYDARFGAATDAGPGAEAVLAPDGTVTALREGRGGSIPASGAVLAGTGDAADWLRAHAKPGQRVSVRIGVRGEDGPLELGGELGVVNGGPRLLRDGNVSITAPAEGFDHPGDPEFLYRFGLRRNPRTLAGVERGGALILVTIDGRQPGYSVGASFAEEAAVMRALGAEDALNLDGGGSTSIAVGGRLVNHPSDAAGERPIGDAILLQR